MPVTHSNGRWVVPVLALIGLGLSAEAVAAMTPALPQVPATVVEAPPAWQETGSDSAGRRLIESVKARDTEAVRSFLLRGTDVNARAVVDGATALHWAAHRDDLEVADLLIAAGANVGATNRYGVAPLALACLNGNASMIETLLNAGADPNTTQPGGETALMTAARTGVVEAVQVLLARGADPNAREGSKAQTALMWAAAGNNADAVQALVEAGAAVHARSNTSLDLTRHEPGGKGFTALLFAARAGRIESTRALLEAGANVNDTLSDGTSALVLATTSAQYDMGVFLLEQGADPDAAAQGWTALHQLAWTRRPNRGYNTVGPVARGAVDSQTFARALLAHGGGHQRPDHEGSVQDLHRPEQYEPDRRDPLLHGGTQRRHRVHAVPGCQRRRPVPAE